MFVNVKQNERLGKIRHDSFFLVFEELVLQFNQRFCNGRNISCRPVTIRRDILFKRIKLEIIHFFIIFIVIVQAPLQICYNFESLVSAVCSGCAFLISTADNIINRSDLQIRFIPFCTKYSLPILNFFEMNKIYVLLYLMLYKLGYSNLQFNNIPAFNRANFLNLGVKEGDKNHFL